MKKQVLFAGIVALGLGITGCKKEKGEYDIHIDSPQKDMTYSSPVPLEMHVHGEDIIHDIEIKVFQKSDPTVVVFDYDNHVEVNEFEVIDTIQASVIAPTVFTISVLVGEDDHVKTYSHDFTIQ